jgi:hypothetical protein
MLRGSRLPLLLCVVALLVSCAADVGVEREPVVYGTDGRTEVYAHPSAVHRGIAETAIAVKIDASWIDDSNPSDVRITYRRTLGEAQDLCSGQRFADQIEPGTCSGTLVDDRHILTAGHCVDTASDCSEYAWVLGFHYSAAGTLAPLTVNDVYRCASVVAYFDDGDVDHAFVRLDRPVTGHTPATMRPRALSVGTPLTLIGHPNGIPMKIDSGGVVTGSASDGRWLSATVDAFSGNSGSGVFDAEGNLVALLRGGEDDYRWTGSCNVVNVLPEGSDGESLTYLGPAVDAFCRSGVASPVCGCEPPCGETLPGDRCANAETVTAASQTLSSTLAGYAADGRGTCGGEGPERSYTFTLDRRTRVIARTSGFDTVLYLRAGGCDGAERGCNDDIDTDTDRGSRLDLTLDAGTYILFVDAYDASVGTYSLQLTFEPVSDSPSSTDAGTPTPTVDAGSSPLPSADAGMPTGPSRPGSVAGGCSAAGHGMTSGLPLGLALLALVLWCRSRG